MEQQKYSGYHGYPVHKAALHKLNFLFLTACHGEERTSKSIYMISKILDFCIHDGINQLKILKYFSNIHLYIFAF